MAIIGISGKIGSGKDTVGKIIQYLTCKPPNRKFNSFEEYIKEERLSNSWEIKKFAGKLKQIVSILTGIPVEDLEKQEVKDKVLGEEWKIGSWDILYGKKVTLYTIRELLQKVGTDAMRNVIHPNIWVNALFSDYQKPCIASLSDSQIEKLKGKIEYPNWIITDMRFPNELKAVKDRGGITIRLDRRCEVCKLIKDERRGKVCYEIACPNGRKKHESETALDNAKFDYLIANNGTVEELIEKVKRVLIKEKII